MPARKFSGCSELADDLLWSEYRTLPLTVLSDFKLCQGVLLSLLLQPALAVTMLKAGISALL